MSAMLVEEPLGSRDGAVVVGCSSREVHLELLPVPEVLGVVDLGVVGEHLGTVDWVSRSSPRKGEQVSSSALTEGSERAHFERCFIGNIVFFQDNSQACLLNICKLPVLLSCQ